MARILLVNPHVGKMMSPTALGKIATYHKNQGDTVDYVVGKQQLDTPLFPEYIKYDKIYVTTLFTWWANEAIDTIKHYQKICDHVEVGGISASLLQDYYYQNTGIMPHKGIDERFEQQKIDYSLFPGEQKTFVLTSRGCVRNCQYCSVKNIEPEYIEYDTILDQLRDNSKWLVILDNNFFANSNWKKIMGEIRDRQCEIDINQAIDCTLFNEDMAKELATVEKRSHAKRQTQCIKFAYDKDYQLKYLQNCAELIDKYNMKIDIELYMLYNFNDNPGDFYQKIMNIKQLSEKSSRNFVVYPMRFQPLDALEWNSYVDEGWTDEWLAYIRSILYRCRGFININRNSEAFNQMWKPFFKNYQRFLDNDQEKIVDNDMDLFDFDE